MASKSSSVLSSPERVVMKLRGRTKTTDVPYTKPKSKSWIKQGLAKFKSHTKIVGKQQPP
jgi:hypothetical protein